MSCSIKRAKRTKKRAKIVERAGSSNGSLNTQKKELALAQNKCVSEYIELL